MGLSLPASARTRQAAAPFVQRAPAVAAGLASALVAGIAFGFAAALIAVGWKELPAAFTASAPQGAVAAILTSAILVVSAMPATLIIAVLAAACAWDVHIGGAAARTLRSWLIFSAAVPPVVVGAAVFLVFTMLGLRLGLWTALLGMVALNVPQTSARIVRILQHIPAETMYATAATGAAPAFAFFSVALRSIVRPLLALALALCAQMLAQTAVIVLAAGLTGDEPLTAQIWKFAPDARLAGYEGAQCLILVAACGFFVAASRLVGSYRSDRGVSLAAGAST
jgi:ABC-type Fe3+ transport system permease subunit